MKFKFLFAAAALGLLATGCNKENTTPIDGGDGEKSVVTLTVSNAVEGAATRAASGEQTATTAESNVNVASGLKVFVFNEDGSPDGTNPRSLTLTGSASPYTSSTFEVNAGKKFFFVFANAAASTIPTAAISNMEVFMKQTIATASVDPSLEIAQANNFLLGTLWAQKAIAPAGGTATTPATVPLTIGRLASKVTLSSIVYTKAVSSPLAGSFSNGSYRMGSLAKRVNVAGVHENFRNEETGATLPIGSATTNKGVTVYSAVHTASPYLNPANPQVDLTYNNTDFSKYSAGNDATFTGRLPLTSFFYVTENTTALAPVQYWGNTTYIQVETVYTPVASELWKDNAGTLEAFAGSLSGNTFWTATVKADYAADPTLRGKRLLFGEQPSASSTIVENVETYTGGKNYHKFAVQDQDETTSIAKNRVLRNHYYDFKVTSFNDLGTPTPEVDPGEPIPDKTSVNIEVTVKGWDKVTQGSIEL
ncbi:MAG: Mfa1 family fimbria major subunit [Alistipes sp.]|jgi:hypothetical protein|nr:Mfa1 family fimbria major subunit [Alistipes sp.]